VNPSRREVLAGASAGLFIAGCAGNPRLSSAPLGLPIGIQAFAVSAELERDFQGTLARLAEIGYREIEMAPPQGRTAAQTRAALDQAGLACPSVGIIVVGPNPDISRQLDGANILGARFVMTPVPPFSNPFAGRPEDFFANYIGPLTVETWRHMIDRLNGIGQACRAAGLQLCYHNHNFEFRAFDGFVPYDELLRGTDADLVKMEMDVGWLVAAGRDPVAYLDAYPGRYPLLHVKDLKAGFRPNVELHVDATEVGSGVVDWVRVFRAARRSGLQHYFVEQDPPFVDRPALEAAAISQRYLENLRI